MPENVALFNLRFLRIHIVSQVNDLYGIVLSFLQRKLQALSSKSSRYCFIKLMEGHKLSLLQCRFKSSFLSFFSFFFRRVEHSVDLNMNAAEGLDGGTRGTMGEREEENRWRGSNWGCRDGRIEERIKMGGKW